MPSCWACRRTASGERPRRRPSAPRSPRSARHTRIASSSCARYGRARGGGGTSARRRARTCSVERLSRRATSEAGRPLTVPALSSACSRGHQGLDRRRGAIPSAWRRATTESAERASRPAICSTGSWSAYSWRSSWSSAVLQRVATAHLKWRLGPRELFDVVESQSGSRGLLAVEVGV